MAKSIEAVQLDFLDQLKPGEATTVPISERGIGGELLNILSKGLYTNPLDAIREYVQNAIDANAEQVEIHVTGNSVHIFDYGDGMNRDELLQARDFGVSNKSILENVGFRGIGIYSGFDLCERLVIRTKTLADDNEHIMEFYFGDMRRKLDAARQSPERPVIPLTTLLEENTHYFYEKSPRPNKKFTYIQLEDLSDKHIHRLSDVNEVRNYILRTLPIRFNEKFPYAETVEKALSKYVSGYKSARVILRIEDEPTITVEKPNIPDLGPPVMGFIRDSNKRDIAYYWACLTSVSEAITSRKVGADFAGLAYKIKGFTVGDRTKLAVHFSRKQIYTWWTGEIYVIDTEVVPTSARDDFEAGPAKDALEAAVLEVLNGAKNKDSLQKIALDAQATRRADEIFQRHQARVENIEKKVMSGEFDRLNTYSELDKILEELKGQKGKVSDKQKANSLNHKVQSLQNRVKKLIEQPTPVSTIKRDAVKAAMTEVESTGQQDTTADTSPDIPSEGSESKTEHEPQIEPQPGPEPKPSPKEPLSKNLLQIVEHSGWMVDENCKQVITLIGEAIADNLGVDTKIYIQLMSDIEERLANFSEVK
jgi:hypothetical protein